MEKAFKLKKEQAKIIAEMPLQAISKLSKTKQENTIRELNQKIWDEKEKLKNPKMLVEKTLKSLMPFNRTRLAKVDYGNEKGEPTRNVLKKSEGKRIYWTIEQKNPKCLIKFGTEIPLRKRPYNAFIDIVDATKGIIIVTEKGSITHIKLQKLIEGDLAYPVIGLVPMTSKYFSISLNSGLCADYETNQSQSQWYSKLLQDGEDKILSVVHYQEKDLLLTFSNDMVTMVQVTKKWATMNKTNKTGRKAFKSLRGRKDIRLKVIPYGFSVYFLNQNKILSFSDITTYILKNPENLKQIFLNEPYILCNPENEMYCIGKDGSRYMLKGGNKFLEYEIVDSYMI